MIKIADSSGMNNHQIDALIRSIGTNVDCERTGAWRFELDEVVLYCITDEIHDRMRVITPIANLDETPVEVIQACMQANFDRALDARYCIHDGTIWGAFIHPLSSLTEPLFESALSQVCQVARNFGGTYSSGALVFGVPTQ